MISSHNSTTGTVPTKIMPPHLKMVLERRRCFQQINTALSKPIVWVSAPAGAGKTTLVASYASAMNLPTLWYSCDERDIDAAVFFSYMQKALTIYNPDKYWILPDFASDGSKDIITFSILYFEQLFEHLKFPCLLVIDDYHKVPAESALHTVFIKGLYQLPEGINVVFTSRNDPPPPFVNFQAKRKLSAIGFDDIRFDLEETAALIKNTTELLVQNDLIDRLYTKTNGWVTGLVLALSQIDRTKTAAEFNESALDEMLFKYFSEEIYNPLPDDIKELLLKTAWLPIFTLEMAAKIAPNGHKILTDSRYFITEKCTDNRVTYAFQSIFRDFLLHQSDGDEAALHALNVLEEHGYIEETAALIIKLGKVESGRWERLENLITTHGQNLIDKGRHTIVDNWLTSLPPEVMQLHPWLLYWQGLNKMYLTPEDSRQILEHAYIIFKKSGAHDGQLSVLCAIVKTIIVEGKDFHPLDYWIAEFEGTLLEGYKCIESDKDRENTVASVFAALVFRQPENIGIDYWLVETEKIVLHSKHIENRIFAGYTVIMYYLWSGLIYKAGVIVDVLSYPARQTKTYPALRLTYLLAEALYFYYKLSSKDALNSVNEGLMIAQQTDMHFMEAALLGVSVYISLAAGDDTTAQVCLTKISPYRDTPQSNSPIYHQLTSLVELSNGALSSAIEHAKRNVALVQKSGCLFMLGVNKYFLAYVLAEAGKHDESMQVLSDIERIAVTTKSELFDYLILAAKSLIYLKTNDIPRFTDMFNKSVMSTERSGIKIFLPLNKSVASVCKTLLKGKTHVERVRELITLHSITTDDHRIVSFPWELKIYTLGQFKILRDGNIVHFTGKPHRTPLTLLKAIISLGGKCVNSLELSDLLWAESDGDAAYSALYTTLHRLRKILGSTDYVQATNGNLYLDQRLCWVDIWALDAIVWEIYEIAENGGVTAVEDIIAAFLRMVSIYKGDFNLESQDEELAAHLRGRLKYKFINCCLDAGDFLEKSDKLEEAIECYKKSLLVYPAEEMFYQKIMRCKKSMGQDIEAAAVYNLCRDTLLSILGKEPSQMTKSIYKSIIKKYRSVQT
ncbi:MAG: hypothetical protein H7843_10215 [Nitrospirota bacterium]